MIEQKIFNGRYRLDQMLGEGGMARVYRGIDTLLRRRVAVKVLREQYAADQEFVHRFYQEAESAAKLSHPNIVNTYDVGHEGEIYYIVMELVDGSSLAEILSTDGRLPEPVAVDYTVQMCTGLAYAHRQGLLHRDVKPANILIGKDDVVKLSDFGIARAVSQQTMTLTKPGLVMGSIYYISPEQAQGHELTEASDLYSVGVVLYQMLTGSLPYTGESPVTVALKHIGDPVPTLDIDRLNVSPALAAIVNKLLQKQPSHRFSSASEVASALREARERPSIPAYRIANDAPERIAPVELPPRRSKMPDRRPSREPYYEEERSRRNGSTWVMLIGAFIVAVAAAFWFFAHPLPTFATNVTVGNYVGEGDASAEQQAINDGLRTKILKSPSNTVALAHVIRQNPAPGMKVPKDSIVELFISNGLPTIGLRDVRGFLAADAQRILQEDKFRVKVFEKYDPSQKGYVIDQRPAVGSRVHVGSEVTLVVSKGPQPMQIPNFIGMSVNQALALAQKMNLSLDTSQQVIEPGQPANAIVEQSPQAGQNAAPGTTVHVAVNIAAQTPPPSAGTTVVPSVVNQPYSAATAALQQAGFTSYIEYAVQNTANGYIIGEDPAGGTQATSGSRVTITLSVPGEVPDTDGMSVQQAESALQSAGYGVSKLEYTTTEGSDGNVVGTDPEVGTNLDPGNQVTLIVNGSSPQ
jgi:beta-lactam-binding protein with PASTA domain/tRNA A-37 threonylcarbamoyl transferase component Bud32